ncbi:MAG: hypothetical protein KGI98_11000 [Euryarchaeota archaeon]|nr:hypothetical protein [Euryarchaeota archaeon]
MMASHESNQPPFTSHAKPRAWIHLAECEIAEETAAEDEVQVLRDQLADLRRDFDEFKAHAQHASFSPLLLEPVTFTLPPGTNRAEIERVKKLILIEFENTPGMYPSDFAKKHDLTYGLVHHAFAELENEGLLVPSNPAE